ncbi:hypothetical protein E5288_WYG001402 [Bos mutus]|uniref:Uncharacterized protein n=1 Tax=Bos mutus TaxID=72004 RepID=A0A6B0R2W6_9CETA|nr:hypothetical protein [Bos mutus]
MMQLRMYRAHPRLLLELQVSGNLKCRNNATPKLVKKQKLIWIIETLKVPFLKSNLKGVISRDIFEQKRKTEQLETTEIHYFTRSSIYKSKCQREAQFISALLEEIAVIRKCEWAEVGLPVELLGRVEFLAQPDIKMFCSPTLVAHEKSQQAEAAFPFALFRTSVLTANIPSELPDKTHDCYLQ